MKLKSLLPVFLLSLFANTLYAEAVLNIDQPIRSLQVTNEQMKSAIVNAAIEQQWLVTPEGDGQMRATYNSMSNYMAEVSIKYSPTFYTINYADSKRMRYKRGNIHPTYNKLIKALQANIIRNLKSGNYTAQKSTAVPSSTSSGGIDDARAKLLTLQKLHEEGLITKDEYEEKRKVLIDSF